MGTEVKKQREFFLLASAFCSLPICFLLRRLACADVVDCFFGGVDGDRRLLSTPCLRCLRCGEAIDTTRSAVQAAAEEDMGMRWGHNKKHLATTGKRDRSTQTSLKRSGGALIARVLV